MVYVLRQGIKEFFLLKLELKLDSKWYTLVWIIKTNMNKALRSPWWTFYLWSIWKQNVSTSFFVYVCFQVKIVISSCYCTFIDTETEKLLETRRDQYKAAALQAKHSGDINTAKKYVQTSKVRIIPCTKIHRLCESQTGQNVHVHIWL